MKYVIVSFSSRKHGNCVKIGNYIQSILPESLHFSFSEFHISSCGDCEGECFIQKEACPHIHDMEQTIIQAISQSCQAIFIVPNHCDYPCANFFAFNERSLCCFQGNPELLEHYLHIPKKFIVVSNSDSPHFAEAFCQHTSNVPDILFLRARQYGSQSITGSIITSLQARNDICAYIHKETR